MDPPGLYSLQFEINDAKQSDGHSSSGIHKIRVINPRRLRLRFRTSLRRYRDPVTRHSQGGNRLYNGLYCYSGQQEEEERCGIVVARPFVKYKPASPCRLLSISSLRLH